MNITITPGAATEDAAHIDEIVNAIKEDMATLDRAIKSTIPDGIQTSWSEIVRNNWESYYSADVEKAMEEMQNSAVNLRLAVEKALQYDLEQQ